MKKMSESMKPLNGLYRELQPSMFSELLDCIRLIWRKVRPSKKHYLHITVALRIEHRNEKKQVLHKKTAKVVAIIK